ncbi:hypothetical protein LIN66_23845, partial [Raoultella ornithinolytica]|nr:hypothetical protein [Raoultella ornithinolytica]
GPDPRNFNQRVSLGRNDLLIRTFHSDFRTAQGKVLAKITYNNHELSFYARKLKDKAWIDISPQVFKDEQTRQVPYDAQGFIEVSKKDAAEIKSKVECTLGAIS